VIFNWMVHVYPFEKNAANIWSVERQHGDAELFIDVVKFALSRAASCGPVQFSSQNIAPMFLAAFIECIQSFATGSIHESSK
jgi:hypothetical protein